MFFLLQNWRTGGRNSFFPGQGVEVGIDGSREGGGEKGRRVNMAQIMYTYVCKCKNDTC
jgi:hypothetical protein